MLRVIGFLNFFFVQFFFIRLAIEKPSGRYCLVTGVYPLTGWFGYNYKRV